MYYVTGIYPNLDAEIVRNRIEIHDLAIKLHVSNEIMLKKLDGRMSIKMSEAKKLKTILNTDLPIEELFDSEVSK